MATEQSDTMVSDSVPKTITFEDLSNDCILLILDEAAKMRGEGYKRPENMRNLSLVNKRLRQLCIPRLFNRDKLSLSRSRSMDLKTFQTLSAAQFVVSKVS